jgi:hypothetical protein
MQTQIEDLLAYVREQPEGRRPPAAAEGLVRAASQLRPLDLF